MNAKIQSQTTINSKKYYFINNNRNFLEFNNLNLNPFIEKFKNKKKFIVAHFGDSHIQPDHLTGYIRKELQNLNGDGGRGMIFPYSIAKTYSQADFCQKKLTKHHVFNVTLPWKRFRFCCFHNFYN